jgi:hypothetical protein
MSVIDFTTDTPSASQGMFVATWANLTSGDTGQPLAYSNLADKTVQVFGTIAGTLTIQGSNDPRVLTDYTNNTNTAAWATLTDNLGNPIVFGAAGLKLIAEAPRYIRPNSSATLATVIIISNAS